MTIQTHSMQTKEGNYLHFFYNPDRNLLVVDFIDKRDRGGNEIMRVTLDENKLLKHLKV